MSASRVSPDDLFQELDGHRLSTNGRDWDVRVFSVTDANDSRWIQLALEGQEHKVLTLRLAPTQDSRYAFDALSCFLADPQTTGNVLSHVA